MLAVAWARGLPENVRELREDLRAQVPQAGCDVVMDNNSRDLLINRAKPPFDNLELRRAMALSLDRQAFIDILAEGQGAVGGTILPPPGLDWICVSPKADAEQKLFGGNELKLVYPQERSVPERYAGQAFDHFFLQPMDNDQRRQCGRRHRLLPGASAMAPFAPDPQTYWNSLIFLGLCVPRMARSRLPNLEWCAAIAMFHPRQSPWR